MPRFSANLSMLFAERPMLDRFAAAARAGFRAVEIQFPYDHPAEAIASALEAHALELVLHNLPAGDWAGGERGIAILPDRVAEFRQGIERAQAYADATGCRQINCLAGVLPNGADAGLARRVLVDNLGHAATRLGAEAIRLLVEPINTRDVPGFFLNSSDAARRLIEEVGSDNLFLQYDIYHMQAMGEDPVTELPARLGRVAHIQFADFPGRHQPGTGAIDFDTLFAAVDAAGYDGHVGAEYLPLGATETSLNWMAPQR